MLRRDKDRLSLQSINALCGGDSYENNIKK